MKASAWSSADRRAIPLSLIERTPRRLRARDKADCDTRVASRFTTSTTSSSASAAPRPSKGNTTTRFCADASDAPASTSSRKTRKLLAEAIDLDLELMLVLHLDDRLAARGAPGGHRRRAGVVDGDLLLGPVVLAAAPGDAAEGEREVVGRRRVAQRLLVRDQAALHQ